MSFWILLRLHCNALFSALGHELSCWQTSCFERMLFTAQVICTLALSVWISEFLGLSYAWWAALSGFAVTMTTLKENARRAFLRLLGTVIGAAAGLLVAPLVIQYIYFPVIACGLAGSCVVYRANESKFSYSWVLGGVTLMMVMFDAQTASSLDSVMKFTLSRISEVAVGVSMSVLSCALITFIVSFLKSGKRLATSADTQHPNVVVSDRQWREKRMFLSLEAGLTITLVSAILVRASISDLSQAIITVLALLILPSGKYIAGTEQQILDRMLQRMTGCLLAGATGILLLPLLHEVPWLYIIVFAAGVGMGCHLQTGGRRISYLGRQFSVAWIMIFIQQHYWSAEPYAAILRFCGIMTGVIVLATIMILIHLVIYRSGSKNR